jgi:hypothetical protein
MFGDGKEVEDRLENAAKLGVSDAGAFDFSSIDMTAWMDDEDDEDNGDAWGAKNSLEEDEEDTTTVMTAADPDAFTVGVVQETQASQELASDTPVESTVDLSDLSSVYEKIKSNKAKAAESIEMGQDTREEKPDFPFRIYHVDKRTNEVIMVPPYTQPGEFFRMKEEGRLTPTTDFEVPFDDAGEFKTATTKTTVSDVSTTKQSRETYDGYSAIREAYGEGATEEETAEATRRARMKNRVKSSEIDESVIGAIPLDGSSRVKSKEEKKANGSTMPSSLLMEERKESSSVKSIVDTVVSNGQSNVSKVLPDNEDAKYVPDSDETTFDGYQAIQEANSSASRDDELEKMRQMRMRNRIKSSDLDNLFQL